MNSADVNAIMKMQRHLRKHLEMLQTEFNKHVLNEEVYMIILSYGRCHRDKIIFLVQVTDVYELILSYGL